MPMVEARTLEIVAVKIFAVIQFWIKRISIIITTYISTKSIVELMGMYP